jgi:hypothetical protein
MQARRWTICWSRRLPWPARGAADTWACVITTCS